MFGLRMVAVKNSMKRTPARSPAAVTSAGRAGGVDAGELVHFVISTNSSSIDWNVTP